MLFAWPLEVTKPNSELRVYTRDPQHLVIDQIPGYLADVPLPATAVDSGLRQDGLGLWLKPADDSFIWLVSDHGAERLPRGGISCA